MEESLGLLADSDEDFEDRFELPQTFEHRSDNAPQSPEPEPASSQVPGREAAEPSVASDPDLVTTASNPEDESPKRRPHSKQTNRRKTSEAVLRLSRTKVERRSRTSPPPGPTHPEFLRRDRRNRLRSVS
jgi:hypothetical protein